MKELLLLLLILPLAYAEVAITNYVNDYTGILSVNESQQISAIAKEIKDSNQAEYAIVLVNSTEGVPIQEYAINLAQGKLGDTEKDDGVLLLIALNDREYRFEVGKGIEGVLNDAKIGRIGRDYLIPAFQNNQYGKGIIDASIAIKEIVVNNQTFEETETSLIDEKSEATIMIILIILAIMFIIYIKINIKKINKHNGEGPITIFGGGRGGFGGSGGFGGGGFGGGGAGGKW